MIRRSKVTAAAASSPPNNSPAVKDGHKTNKSDRFASKCHATDTDNNLTNTSSDTNNCTFHQECTRLNYKHLTKSTADTTSKTQHNHCLLPKSIAPTYCFIIVATIVLFTYQLDAYIREYQGPLDHISTTIRIPYYDMSCPSFSQYVGSMESSSSNGRDNENDISLWDCNVILRKKQTTINDDHDDIVQGKTWQSTTEYHSSTSPPFPRIFMIGARDEAQDTFQSWQSQLQFKDSNNTTSPHHTDEHTVFSSSQPYLKRINTLEVSNQFATSGGALRDSNTSPFLRLPTSTNTTTHQTTTSNQKQHAPHFLCRNIKWEQRLFHVYQYIFTELLATYPNDDGFVIIEDDATLLNPIALAEEVCSAHDHQIQFYSLYRSPLQRRVQWRWRRMNSKEQASSSSSSYSCVYQHGTVAFYIQRQLMQQIINEHRRSFFCRFPIDMYISKFGPWYATTNEVVGHLGRGRIGSS